MQRFILGIVFLFLYGTALIRPVYPLLEFVVNHDYISQVLCENKDQPQLNCDGKCVLAKKLKAANTAESPEPGLINPYEFPFSLPESESDLRLIPQTNQIVFDSKSTFLLDGKSRLLFRPPQEQAVS